MSLMHRSTAVLVPVMVGGAFLAAARLAPGSGEDFFIVLGTIFCGLMAAVFAGCAIGGLGLSSGKEILQCAFTPVLFAASSFGFLLTVETPAGRYAVTIAAMALIGIYFDELVRVALSHGGRSREPLDRFSALLLLLSVFYFLAFAYGFNSLLHLPMIVMAPAAGLLMGLACLDIIVRSGEFSRASLFSLAIGFAGAELFAAFLLLPTAGIVNAAAVSLLFFAAVRLAGMPDLARQTPWIARRQFVSSVALAVLVLATAQWT